MGAGLLCLWLYLRERRSWAKGLVVPLLLVMLAGTYMSNFPVADGRKYYFSYDYGMNMLRSCPPGAIMICAGDIDILPLWYLHYVEGVRPDVAVVTVQLLPYEWYRKDLAREYPYLAMPSLIGDGVSQQVGSLTMIQNNISQRPICYSFIYMRPWLMKLASLPQGMVNLLVSEERRKDGPDLALDQQLWDSLVTRQCLAERSYLDRYTGVLVDNYGLTRESIGLSLINRGAFAAAMEYYRQALKYRSRRAHENIFLGMARCAAGMNDMQSAIVHLSKCLGINPGNFIARVNLASYYGRIGDLRGALREYRVAQQIKPSDPNLARVISQVEMQLIGR